MKPGVVIGRLIRLLSDASLKTLEEKVCKRVDHS